MKIVVHPAYDTYPARGEFKANYEDQKFRAEYVIEANRYFVQHSDYDAVASSTLAPQGEHKYDVDNIKGLDGATTWAEGVDGDGVGENITLTVHRPLPLDSIMIAPGYKSFEDPTLWTRNNRVAELEVTLNGEHTFTAAIPDDKFNELYPIPVRGYTKPVTTVKLVIKAVHRPGQARARYLHFAAGIARQARQETGDPARPVSWRWASVFVLAAASRWAFAAPITLPVYIEDSHAGSFYWLAEHLDLDEEYTLIHFDAHSDASGIFDSDQLRERLRRVGSLEERRNVLDQWRKTGAIQCYNWIEPLMPAPISRMIWVPGPTLSKTSATRSARKKRSASSTGIWKQRRASRSRSVNAVMLSDSIGFPRN